MKTRIVVLLLALFYCHSISFAQKEFVNTSVRLSGHPRLLLQKGEEKTLKKMIMKDVIWKDIHQSLLDEAEDIVKLPLNERIKTGKRLFQPEGGMRPALEPDGYVQLYQGAAGFDRTGRQGDRRGQCRCDRLDRELRSIQGAGAEAPCEQRHQRDHRPTPLYSRDGQAQVLRREEIRCRKLSISPSPVSAARAC